MKKSIYKVFSILFFPVFLTAQINSEFNARMPFMVRQPQTVSDIAEKFNISKSSILAANKIKGGKNILPGKVLIIPVPMKYDTWNPLEGAAKTNLLPPEDARPADDKVVDYSKLSIAAAEDFINLQELKYDSIQFEKIQYHSQKIKKSIQYFNFQIDSSQKEDFGTEYDEKNVESVVQKMAKAKEMFYVKGTIGRKIDSLQKLQKLLSVSLSKIQSRLNEYENLAENAAYYENTNGKDFKSENWSNNLAQQNTFKKQEQKFKEFASNNKKTDDGGTLKVAFLEKQVANKSAELNPKNVHKNDQNLKTIKSNSEILETKNHLKAEDTFASLEGKIPSNLLTPNRKTEPEYSLEMKPAPPLNRNEVLRRLSKYDFKEEKVLDDPLEFYKTDSVTVWKTIQIKDVSIVQYKNKPKYLIPVDSIRRIKAEFYFLRAKQTMTKGDFINGELYLRKSLDLNPNNAAAWILHADLYVSTGESVKATKEYNIATQIEPKNPKPYYNLALLYAKANDESKALEYFSKTLEINSNYLQAYFGRADLFMKHRDYVAAIDDYDKVLALQKNNGNALKLRGLAKMEMRDFTSAVADFNVYIENEKPDGYITHQRGIAKIMNHQLLEGCLDLSSALDLGFKEASKSIKKFCN